MKGARLLLAAALALLVQACAFAPQLGQVAVDHNRMVADSTDELTLLNIVRARYRFPLHFTAVTEINGSVGLNANANLGIDLDPVVDPTSTSLGAGVSTNPSFRAAVLATEKFQRGIQTPLDAQLIAYYLDEGWRDSLLMALTIERVEVFADPFATQPLFSIVNEAERDSEFARFLCTYEMRSQPGAATVPLARFDQLLNQTLLQADATSAAERRAEINALTTMLGNSRVRLSGDTLVLEGSSNVVRLLPAAHSRCVGAVPDPRLAGMTLRPRFRSTLGIIYFLGEYQRIRSDSRSNAAYFIPHCDSHCRAGEHAPERRPLINIAEGDGQELIATQFEGRRFYVSAEELRGYDDDNTETARTMQVITFLQQLINLQKSADQLPTSLTVTRVN